MKTAAIILVAGILAFGALADGEENQGGGIILADKFDRQEIGPGWVVKEGQWSIRGGSLFNADGGIILAARPIEGDFVLECEVRVAQWKAQWPWVSVLIGYENNDHYQDLSISPGEQFYYLCEKAGEVHTKETGGRIPFEKDAFHKVRLECCGGGAQFYWDGKHMGACRYGQILSPTMIGFMGKEESLANKKGEAEYEIRDVKVSRLAAGRVVGEVTAKNIRDGEVWKDKGSRSEREGAGCVGTDEEAWLTYKFGEDKEEYEAVFARIKTGEIGASEKAVAELKGDGSGNKVYMIVRDSGGEEHLIGVVKINWDGWRKTSFNYGDYLKSPGYNVFATHWGGDSNQVVDFPIDQIEIGVAKSGDAEKRAGKIGLRKIRFVKYGEK